MCVGAEGMEGEEGRFQEKGKPLREEVTRNVMRRKQQQQQQEQQEQQASSLALSLLLFVAVSV